MDRGETYLGETVMIVIEPYHPEWPDEFETLRARIAAALGPLARRVDHIGSTSIPGLGAKNIIDIQITVREITPEVTAKLTAAGFEHRPNVDRDHVPEGEDAMPELWRKQFFYQPPGERRANVHVRIEGNPNQRYAILFRDYLREHPTTVKSVELVKRQIAKLHPNDEDAYYDIKDPVYDLIWSAAQDWAKETGWKI